MVVNPAVQTIIVAEIAQFDATPVDGNGSPLVGRPVTWASSDEGIVTVGSTGIATGITPGGPVTISATSEGVSERRDVTVIPTPSTGLPCVRGGSDEGAGLGGAGVHGRARGEPGGEDRQR